MVSKEMLKKYFILTIFVLLFLVLGILFLNIVGKFFITEITQEVKLSYEEGKIENISLGDKAPYWELDNLSNETIRLLDFSDKPVLITFWSTWNEVSVNQLKIFDDYLLQNNEKLFYIVTINSQEDKSIVSNFINRAGYNVRVLLDETGELGEDYGIRNLPITYFIDKESMIQDIFVGVLSEEMLIERISPLLRE